jgi:hypothetical protein|tara:strand:- start:200 stop:364 length:165 start_codon:yes stop_codon:yes gene_type:complete
MTSDLVGSQDNIWFARDRFKKTNLKKVLLIKCELFIVDRWVSVSDQEHFPAVKS